MKVLFATSNGTGLGHLNRAMAIARRLPDDCEPVLFTLSQAVPAVLDAGFRVEYHPSYRRPGSGSDWQWNMRLRGRFEALLEREQPDLVLFDGVHPYRAVTHVLGGRGAPPSIWCRRPMWRADSSPAPLKRTGAFDAVLEPGELAAEADRGPTVGRRDEVVAVDPIIFLSEDELLPREEAAAALGLDPERTTALVNLGQGGATDRAVGHVLERLSAEPDLQVAALQSSIGAGLEVPDGIIRLRATFPMSRYFRAFDLSVAAAGYNAFHELIAFALPSLFVPMPRNTDDQRARSDWAAAHGTACAVTGPDDPALEARLEPLLDPAFRSSLRRRCREVFPGNGAAAAAALVASMAAGEPAPKPVDDQDPLSRWLYSSSHRVGPSLPLALGLTARDLARHPERRRPKGLVLALGCDQESFGAEVAVALESLELPADRVLLLTDSLDFEAMRRLGVAIHRIPAASEVGLAFEDPSYDELVDEHFDLALAPWRGKWPLRRIGRFRALS